MTTPPRQPSVWAAVDHAPDPDHLAGKLRALAAQPAAAAYKSHAAAQLGLGGGARVLDVGCGVGTDLPELVSRVAPGGRVVGVDASHLMLAAAAAAAPAAELVLADAHALPFPDEAFDAVRIDRVLTYVQSPETVVGEAYRVARVGGMLVASETDWGTAAVSSPPDLDGMTDLVLDRLRRHFPDDRMGRRLLSLLRRTGAARVDVTGHVLATTDFGFVAQNFGLPAMCDRLVAEGRATPEDAAGWLAAVAGMADRGEFCAAVTVWTAAAVRS